MSDSCYNGFATDYDNKRRNPWVPFKEFLEDLKELGYEFNGVLIDLGCGNGRNLPLLKNPNNILLGIDKSLEVLKKAKNRDEFQDLNTNFLMSDMLALPIRPNSINSIFSIAAIHHVMNKGERKLLIKHFNSVLKKNGSIIISVWRKFQKKYRNHFIFELIKRSFLINYKKKQKLNDIHEFGDIIIPWTVSRNQISYNRYYHLFSRKELKKLLSPYKILKMSKMGGPNKKDNFFVIARKKLKIHSP